METTRAHPRYPIRLGAEVMVDGRAVRGATYDVSQGGCRFEASQPLPEGQQFEVHLRVVFDDVQDPDVPPLITQAEVRWCGPTDETPPSYYSGLEFRGLSPEQAQWIEQILSHAGGSK